MRENFLIRNVTFLAGQTKKESKTSFMEQKILYRTITKYFFSIV